MFSEPQNSLVSTGALAPDEQISLSAVTATPMSQADVPRKPRLTPAASSYEPLHFRNKPLSPYNQNTRRETIYYHVGFLLKSEVLNSIYSIMTALLKNNQNHSTEKKKDQKGRQSTHDSNCPWVRGPRWDSFFSTFLDFSQFL